MRQREGSLNNEHLAKMEASGAAAAPVEILFNALDADGDGVITRQELRDGLAAPAAPTADGSGASASSGSAKKVAQGGSATKVRSPRAILGTPRTQADAALLAEFENIQRTLADAARAVHGSTSVLEATRVGGAADDASGDAALPRVTEEAAQAARREATRLLAEWAGEVPLDLRATQAQRTSARSARAEPAAHAAAPSETWGVSWDASADGAPSVPSVPLSSSGSSDAPIVWAPPSGPDPVQLEQQQRQETAKALVTARLAGAADWQQQATLRQQQLEAERAVQADADRRAASRQRRADRERAGRVHEARTRRWERTKAKAAAAMAEESAASAGREESRWKVKAKQTANKVASVRRQREESQALEDTQRRKERAKARARAEKSKRSWELSRSRAESAGRDHRRSQARSEQRLRESSSRRERSHPSWSPPPTVREAWRPPLPYEDAMRAGRSSLHGQGQLYPRPDSDGPSRVPLVEETLAQRRGTAQLAVNVANAAGAEDSGSSKSGRTTPSPTLPHEHVRSPSQSKPGRGSPYAPTPEPSAAAAQAERFSPVEMAPPADVLTDQLVELAYKITDTLEWGQSGEEEAKAGAG